MQRRVLPMLVLAFLLALVPTAAQAKGVSAASISGGGPGGLPGGLPGGPIDVKGDGEPGSGSDLSNLAEEAGMWSLLFEDGQPGNLDSSPAPAASLGPRYTVTWTFPDGAGGNDKVRQAIWPYAAGGPVTYLAPGQPVMGTRTEGGWFRATDSLRRTLITLGLPKRQPLPTPPAPAASSPAASAPAGAVDNPAQPASGSATLPHRGAEPGIGWLPAALVAGLLVVVAAAVLVVGRRRRSGPGTATARGPWAAVSGTA